MGQGLIFLFFGIAALYLFMLNPDRSRKDRMELFERTPIAHRGLHDAHARIPENSLAAFQRAAAEGYGIELDVRETFDEQLVVMHDSSLLRMTGFDLKVEETRLADLEGLYLKDSDEHIPELHEVLALVNGRVPLVIEIKCDAWKADRICEHVSYELDRYEGTACIESFHPGVLRWFYKNRPQVLRGQLAERFSGEKGLRRLIGIPASCCLADFLTHPDFIAYNCRHVHLVRFWLLRHVLRAETAGWTVRSAEEMKKLARDFDVFIFEGFRPEALSNEETAAFAERNAGKAGRENVMQDKIRKHMIITGRVQGVGFRYRATNIAQGLDVTGWVKNLPDDSVEMEVQGTEVQLDMMMQQLRAQRWIEIDTVREKKLPTILTEYEFKVRY